MVDGGITIGSVRIVSVSDAVLHHPIPLDLLFPTVSPEAWDDYREGYPNTFGGRNAWRANVGCFLVQSQGRTVLVDTGLGEAGGRIAVSLQVPGGGSLPEKLRWLGVPPEDVDLVFFTHLHRDHVGWNTWWEDGRPRLTFPRARYVVQEDDWEAFHRPEVQTALRIDYAEQVVTPLRRLGGLELVSGDLRITDEVMAIRTSGHTPGHMSLVIASGGRKAMITGDALVHPAQVADAGCTFRFDMDVEKARETRQSLLDRIEGEGITMVGGHFPGPGFGRIVQADGRRCWQALK